MKRPQKKKQKPGRNPRRPPAAAKNDGLPGRPEPTQLQLKRLDGNRFALQPPACAQDRQDDLDDVNEMIAAGELEIARDELLYLVSDCRGFLEAHNRLGELALEEDDLALARGHFGFAFEIGIESLPEGFRGALPATVAYNAPFFLAGRGLARCLIARGERAEGRKVLEQLARFDPRDESIRRLLTELDEAEDRKKETRS
jgi:hypothetical protein